MILTPKSKILQRFLWLVLLTSCCLTHAQAQCYEGDCQNGFGVHYFATTKMKYTGFFKGGRPHGDGKAVWENGNVYDGLWLGGRMHGEGTMTLNSGLAMAGRWENGAFKGEIKDNEADIAVVPPKPKPKPVPPQQTAKPKITPQVWALSVGVANYDPAVMNPLSFTWKDAERMQNFWKSQKGGALDANHLKILTNSEATHENIVAAMKSLFSKAGPKDMIIFYFSGHGLESAFLPVDYDGVNNELTHSEICEIMKSSRASYKVCIADACHSGGLYAAKGYLPQKFLENLAKSAPGTAFLMSSRKEEQSLESKNLQGGLFSYYVLRGMNGEADDNGNGIISIEELSDFVSKSVNEHLAGTKLRQTPVLLGEYDANMPVSVVR